MADGVAVVAAFRRFRQRRRVATKRAILTRLAVIAAAVWAIISGAPGFAAGVPNGFIHVLIASRIAAINQLDPSTARRDFDGANAYAVVGHDNPASLRSARQLLAAGWHFQLAVAYYDVPSFQADVAAHALVPGLAAVVYDNENSLTRSSEIGNGGFNDPTSRRAATRHFYNLAKAQGLTVILAPGTVCDADRVLARRRFSPDACYAYLRDIAPYADIIDPQLQGLIRSPGAHQAAVSASTALIRSANPRIKVLAQFTTAAFRHYTPAQNIAAMRAALPYVDGIWANIGPSPESLQQGIEVLRALH
jgi:hypothetical protein